MPNYWQRRNYPPKDYQQGGGLNGTMLREGLTGLFFTVDGDPGRAIKEARRLLDEFGSVRQPGELEDKESDKNQTVDISDVLANCCSSGTVDDGRWPRDKWCQDSFDGNACQLTDTLVRSTLFFTVPEEFGDVYQLAEKLISSCQLHNRCRFLARVIPVDRIVRAFKETFDADLQKYVSEKIAAHSIKKKGVGPPSFAVDFSHRNSDMVKRQAVFDLVTDVFTKESPGSAVSLEQPKLLIIVQVIRSFVLLSCVDGIHYLTDTRRFSLRSPTDQQTTNSKDEKSRENNDDVIEDIKH